MADKEDTRKFLVEVTGENGALTSEVVEATDADEAKQQVLDTFYKNNKDARNVSATANEYTGEAATPPSRRD